MSSLGNMYQQHLLVSYSTFKLATALGVVYYTVQPSGYFGFCVSAGRVYSCLIDKFPDIEDFDNNIKPTANEATSSSDALALSLLDHSSDNLINVSSSHNQSVHNNIIDSSSNHICSNLQGALVDFIVNIVGPIEGTNPSIIYTIQEVDAGNRYTLLGNPITLGPLNTIGFNRISINLYYSNSIKISWTIGGSNTIFNNIYATLLSKNNSISIRGEYNDGYTSFGTKSILIAGTDGANIRNIKLYDLDINSATIDYNLGVSLRLPGDGGSLVGGVFANPIRIDPTGTTTQPVVFIETPSVIDVLGVRLKALYADKFDDDNNAIWSDDIGGGLDFIDTGGNTRPKAARTPSGRMAVYFDGNLSSPDIMAGGSISGLPATYAGSGNYMWFVCFRHEGNLGPDEWAVIINSFALGPTSIDPYSHKLNGYGSESNMRLDDGAWHHVVMIGNATTGIVKMYVDRVLQKTQGTGQLFGSDWNTGSPFGLGAHNGNIVFRGHLAHMGFAYSDLLFDDDLPALFNALDKVIHVNVGTSGFIGASYPGFSTAVGFTDGSSLRPATVYNGYTGGVSISEYVLGTVLRKPGSDGTVLFGTSTDPIRIDPTGTTTQPISVVSLPLPTGAATESSLTTRLADATFTSRINTLGQKTMSASTPVAIASNQSAIPVVITEGEVGNGVQKILYDIGNTDIYIGTAAQGTASNSALWLIKKITLDVSGNPVSTLYSDDTAVWDDRTSEIYS